MMIKIATENKSGSASEEDDVRRRRAILETRKILEGGVIQCTDTAPPYEANMRYLVNYHTQKTVMPERKYIEADTRSEAVTKLLDEIPEAIISEMYEMQPRTETPRG